MHDLDTKLKQEITVEQAWFYSIVPSSLKENKLELFISQSDFNESIKDELELVLGKKVELNPIPDEELNIYLVRNYRKAEVKTTQKYNSNLAQGDFLGLIIQEASDLKSSDVHIEIYEEKARVRFRIDGKLLEKYIIDKSEYPSLINKIKIRANLDISEKRLPQDGRILFNQQDKFDIRVSVLPSMFGEKIVLRLLKKESADLDLKKLGLSDTQLNNYLTGIKKTHGIVLISGPTGSGKTTTLYSTLKLLNNSSNNILTIEDPVEYTLEGINQVQLKEDIGLNFTKALRTFLRQDPDIIMLGEIRDSETAHMAIRASLTGHLVLSTIHTNSAWEIISRLLDMGVPSYLIASTLNLAVAQRLVRLLCPACKKKVPFDNKEYITLDIEHHYISVGCTQCYFTGYKGRKAIYEIITINSQLEKIIRNGGEGVEEYLEQKEFKKLRDMAFEMIKKGESSIDEVLPIMIS